MKKVKIEWGGCPVICEIERGPFLDRELGYFGYTLIPIKPEKEPKNKNVTAKWLFEKTDDFKDGNVRLFLKEREITFL